MQVLKQRFARRVLNRKRRNPRRAAPLARIMFGRSYQSYAYDEVGMVKINQWPKAELRQRLAA